MDPLKIKYQQSICYGASGGSSPDRRPGPVSRTRPRGAAPIPSVARQESGRAGSAASLWPRAPPRGCAQALGALGGRRVKLARVPAERCVPSLPPGTLQRPACDRRARAAGAGAPELRGVRSALPPVPRARPPPEAAEEGRAAQIPFIAPSLIT